MKPHTILIVTDDPATASAATEAATELHRDVYVASGPSALSALMDDCGDFDVAVVDLDRHSGNQKVFKTAAGRMPVIGVAGNHVECATKLERHCHASAHLQKPVDTERARVALREALQHAHGE